VWPRLLVAIHPTGHADGEYRVRLRKGWWAGPGHGGQSAVIGEFLVELRATTERERIAEALRAAADELS
jgi:hypothetical protein